MDTGIVQAFEHEWRAIEGDSFATRLARQSLEASAADDPTLEAAVTRLKAEAERSQS